MEYFESFNQAFDAETRQWLSDGELAPAEFSLEIAELLREGGPWGQGFPEPLFDGVFEVLSHQVMKEQHLKLSLRLPGAGFTLEAVAFNQIGHFVPGTARVRIAYRLDVNEWRGQRRLQLLIAHLEAA
jgi:single-stranded-DNA-specific exonuclease